jgi:hypothetical protein
MTHVPKHAIPQANVKPEEPQYNIYQLCMRGHIDKVRCIQMRVPLRVAGDMCFGSAC